MSLCVHVRRSSRLEPTAQPYHHRAYSRSGRRLGSRSAPRGACVWPPPGGQEQEQEA